MYSTKPYLIRAIYEWCTDKGYTPFISVRVDNNTHVPMEYVENGGIVLNIDPVAAKNLIINNDKIQFSTRFNGLSRNILIPINTVTSIFSKETHQGLTFSSEEETPEDHIIIDISNIDAHTEQNIVHNTLLKDKKTTLRVIK